MEGTPQKFGTISAYGRKLQNTTVSCSGHKVQHITLHPLENISSITLNKLTIKKILET